MSKFPYGIAGTLLGNVSTPKRKQPAGLGASVDDSCDGIERCPSSFQFAGVDEVFCLINEHCRDKGETLNIMQSKEYGPIDKLDALIQKPLCLRKYKKKEPDS